MFDPSPQPATEDDGEGILSAAASIAPVAAGLERRTLCIHRRYVASKCAVIQKTVERAMSVSAEPW